MNIFDFIIILIIIVFALIGFKRGFTKELISFVGFAVIVILSYYLKNPISELFYENLPFFEFGGVIKGVTVLNILVYEIIAFLLVLAILSVALKILTIVSSIFEKILKMTIILGIPSKILGAIVGLIEGYVISFVLIYVCNLPVINNDLALNSNLGNHILKSTPILSNIADNTVKVFNEFSLLKEEYKDVDDARKFNQDTLNLFIKYDVIDKDMAQKLVSKGKLKDLIVD